jgi:hypothetical protein
MSDHVPGFSLRLEEQDARSIADGVVPLQVARDVAEMLKDYDAHLAQCQAELDRKASRRKKTA